MNRRTISLFVASTVAALASPANALALDRFVDLQTGSDSGTCSSQASPCQSPAYAANQVTGADTIKVDDSASSYTGSTALVSGASITGFEFVDGDEGDVILDGGSSVTIDVQNAQTAGTISGLTLRSSNIAVRVNGSLSGVTNNVFDSGGGGQVDIDVNAGSPTISQNTFSDLSTTLLDRAITVDLGSPTIIDNDFTNQAVGIDIGIDASAPDVRIEENQITGTHAAGFSNGYGISVGKNSSVVIEDNVLTSGSATGQQGISIAPANNTNTPVLEMRRNQVYGYPTGVSINDTATASLNGDVIAGSTSEGVTLFDDTAPGDGAAAMKNVTIISAGTATAEVNNVNSTLTLDSSILGEAGIDSPQPAASCTITRSRGPVTTPGDDGCMNFQTAVAPNFVNAAGNNYHLTANNPALIDQGDPLVPIAPDNLDFDLQKRSIDGDGNCSEVRDIGADEFLPAAPTANITTGPDNASTIATTTTQFGFTNSNTCGGASFQCSVDGAAFSTCTSPASVGPLTEGAHTFAVRALDLVPQAGAPASRSFTVNLPDPPVPSPPAKKKCKKGQKLKKGKCVKKKKKK